MTIGDLLRGTWTWIGLLWTVLPVVALAGTAFWAGWQSGWNHCFQEYVAMREDTP